MTPGSKTEMNPEFDKYALDYAALLQDPIRDRFAPGSRFFFERKLILIRDYYRARAEDTPSMSWLDVGCGQGDLLRLGKAWFGHVSGCDPSASMLQACAGLNVVHQKAPTVLPFSAESFDLITAVCVYHHVDGAGRVALALEACRVLKPGGIFCIIEHNPYNPITQLIVHRTPVDADARLLTARTAKAILRAAGMRVIETTYFLYFPERLYYLLARVENLLKHVPLGGQYATIGQKPRTGYESIAVGHRP